MTTKNKKLKNIAGVIACLGIWVILNNSNSSEPESGMALIVGVIFIITSSAIYFYIKHKGRLKNNEKE